MQEVKADRVSPLGRVRMTDFMMLATAPLNNGHIETSHFVHGRDCMVYQKSDCVLYLEVPIVIFLHI